MALPIDPRTRAVPRITSNGVAIFLLAYGLLAAVYSGVVVWGTEGLSFGMYFPRVLLGYGLKAIFTLPVWWITVRWMHGRHAGWTLGAHAVLCPLFILGWRTTFYAVAERVGVLPTFWAVAKWDLYLPFLVYVAQFALMHLAADARKLRAEQEYAAQLRDAALHAELSALRARVDPHFLFNTLNTLSASAPPEHEGLRRSIAKLGSLLRYTLHAADRESTTLKEEFQFVRDYLDLEHERLGDRLRVHYDVDESLLATSVPPVLLQPLVENALKHGIAPAAEPGEVWLSLRRVGSDAECGVKNTCAEEAAPDPGFGVGMQTTDDRLALTFGEDARLAVRREPRRFEVTFRVPTTADSSAEARG